MMVLLLFDKTKYQLKKPCKPYKSVCFSYFLKSKLLFFESYPKPNLEVVYGC